MRLFKRLLNYQLHHRLKLTEFSLMANIICLQVTCKLITIQIDKNILDWVFNVCEIGYYYFKYINFNVLFVIAILFHRKHNKLIPN